MHLIVADWNWNRHDFGFRLMFHDGNDDQARLSCLQGCRQFVCTEARPYQFVAGPATANPS